MCDSYICYVTIHGILNIHSENLPALPSAAAMRLMFSSCCSEQPIQHIENRLFSLCMQAYRLKKPYFQYAVNSNYVTFYRNCPKLSSYNLLRIKLEYAIIANKKMCLTGKPRDVLSPNPSLSEGVILMSTYEELNLIISISLLIVAILNLKNKK